MGTGLDVVAEEYTSGGRIDLVVRVGEEVYVIEFKVIEVEGKRPRTLEVIKSKGYVEKYLSEGKEVYLVGIDFSRKRRNIVNFE